MKLRCTFVCRKEGAIFKVGTFEHFISYGYFENFRETTNTVMWKNHKSFLSHRLQIKCAIYLCVMQLLFIFRCKY